MIDFIKGRIALVFEDSATIVCGNIGYRIFLRKKDVARLKKREPYSEVLLHTYYSHVEEEVKLYGFFDFKNREMFCEIININGIGRKTALAILDMYNYTKMESMIKRKDFSELQKVKGIGKKIVGTLGIYYSKRS